MKKITLCLMLILALVIVPGAIFAAEGDVAQVGENDTYATLEEAVAVGGNVKLLANVELNKVLDITGNVTLDLNGFSITPNSALKAKTGLVIVHNGGTLTINDTVGTGKITGSTNNNVYGCIQVTKKGNTAEKPATVVVNGGTLQGYYYAINGNGGRHNTNITINDGTLKAINGLGIFHPQNGTLTVNDGTIEGSTGIEMRAGTLAVNGGKIIATAGYLSVNPSKSGSTTVGAAIAVAQHTTGLDTKVVVNGGTMKGYAGLYQSNIQGNAQEAVNKVSLEVNGGSFDAVEDYQVYSENKTNFITGGNFEFAIDTKYLESDIALEKDENGNWVAAERTIKVQGLENAVNATETEKIILDSFAKWEKENPTKAEQLKNLNITLDLYYYNLLEEDINSIPFKNWKSFEEALNKKDANAILTEKTVDIWVDIYAEGNGCIDSIYELEKPITVKISLPENLPTVAEGYERKYYVVREHSTDYDSDNFTYDVLDAELDGKTLKVTSDKFSLYVVGYSDAEKQVTPPAGDDNTEDTTVTPPTAGEGTTGEGEKAPEFDDSKVDTDTSNNNKNNENVPQTGDNVVVYAVLAVVAIAGIAVTIRMRKK